MVELKPEIFEVQPGGYHWIVSGDTWGIIVAGGVETAPAFKVIIPLMKEEYIVLPTLSFKPNGVPLKFKNAIVLAPEITAKLKVTRVPLSRVNGVEESNQFNATLLIVSLTTEALIVGFG